MDYVNKDLPADSKILFLWEPRGYYCQPPALPDATLDNLAQLRAAHGSDAAALDALESGGFTHLLLYRTGLEFLKGATSRPPTLSSLLGRSQPEEPLYPLAAEDLALLEDLLARSQLDMDVGGVYEIHRLPW
jgi:hypothetical protein